MTRYRVLGPVRIWAGDAWSPVRAGQQRLILAVLLAEAGRVVSTGQLINEIWGDEPPRRAVSTVQGYIFRLRRLLGGGRCCPLMSSVGGYEFVVDDAELDALVFDRLVADGRRELAAGRLDAAVTELSQALALWQGSAFADVAGRHVVPAAAQRLELTRLDVAEERLDALLTLGRSGDVATEAYGLLTSHPLRERLHLQLMLALHRAGRRVEALDAYQRARHVLVTELGLEPGSELRELQQAILAEDRPAPSAADATGGWIPPAQLPAGVAGFTGRSDQLTCLDSSVPTDDSATTVVAITGAPGVGKTALAVHWAHRAVKHFPDGQLHVDLRGYAPGPAVTPMAALARLLRACGVPPAEIPSDVDEAAARYRSVLAGRRMLVLLDNARDATQVRPLLPGGPQCVALITSRDRLGGLVAGEGAISLALGVLDANGSHDLLARALGPDDRIEAEADAASELAHLCGHLPLALRIAAASLTTRPHVKLAQYVDELWRDRLTSLHLGDDAHDGVKAAFEPSYRALPADARRLFRLLGLVPGSSLTGEAAAALVGLPIDHTVRLLRRLADAHLVDECHPYRYTQHDLMHSYAHAQAMLEDDPEARRRLPGSSTGGRVFGDHADALGWLDGERDNLVAAVEYASENGPWAAAYRLADGLRGYLHYGLYKAEWAVCASAALRAAEADGGPVAIAAAHLSLGALHWSRMDNDAAARHFAQAHDLARRSGWAHGESAALGNLGSIHWSTGHLREAAEHYGRALEIDRRIGWVVGEATKISNLGLVYSQQGRPAAAAEHHARALDLNRRAGNLPAAGRNLADLGDTYLVLGRLGDAQAALEEALALHGAAGDRDIECETTRCLAEVQLLAGHHNEAVRLADTALALAREHGDARYQAQTLLTRARLFRRDGELARAQVHQEEALDLALKARNERLHIEAGLELAATRRRLGRADEVMGEVRQALAAAQTLGYRILEGRALIHLAALQLDLRRTGEATESAGQALHLLADTGHRLGQAHAHLALARALHQGGRLATAAAHECAARTLCTEMGVDLTQ